MIAEFAAVVWKKIPYRARRAVVRLTQPSFTVAVIAIVTNSAGEVLLLDHMIRPSSGWGLPGGFLSHREHPEAGLRREMDEETGLELSDVRLIKVRTLGGHLEIVFRAAAAKEPKVKSTEIKGFGWFAASSLPAEMNSGQRALIESVLDDEFEKNERAN